MSLNAQLAIGNRLRNKQNLEASIIEQEISDVSTSNLLEVKGFGKDTVGKLAAVGIFSKEELISSDLDFSTVISNPFALKAINNLIEEGK